MAPWPSTGLSRRAIGVATGLSSCDRATRSTPGKATAGSGCRPSSPTPDRFGRDVAAFCWPMRVRTWRGRTGASANSRSRRPGRAAEAVANGSGGPDGRHRRARPCGSRTPVSPPASTSRRPLAAELRRRFLGRRMTAPSRSTCSATPCGPLASTTRSTSTTTSPPASATTGRATTAACEPCGRAACSSSGSSPGWAGTSRTWSTPCRICRPAAWACECSPARGRRSTPRPRAAASCGSSVYFSAS